MNQSINRLRISDSSTQHKFPKGDAFKCLFFNQTTDRDKTADMERFCRKTDLCN